MSKKIGNGKIILLISAVAGVAAAITAFIKRESVKKLFSKAKEAVKTEKEEIHFSDFEDIDNDVVFADTDGDGNVDVAFVDTTGDGKLDTAFVDVDGNGTVDIAIPVEEVAEESAEEAADESAEEAAEETVEEAINEVAEETEE